MNNFSNFNKIGDGIFTSIEPIVRLSIEQIKFLKAEAKKAEKKRSRICAHHDSDDLLHEMIIVLCSETYIHPHRHLGKSESFHIIEGEVDIVVLSDNGNVEEVIELGDVQSGKNFFYRLNDSKYHTLLIYSDYLVVHEVTNGPFSRELTELAPFAPDENESDKAMSYINSLKDSL